MNKKFTAWMYGIFAAFWLVYGIANRDKFYMLLAILWAGVAILWFLGARNDE